YQRFKRGCPIDNLEGRRAAFVKTNLRTRHDHSVTLLRKGRGLRNLRRLGDLHRQASMRDSNLADTNIRTNNDGAGLFIDDDFGLSGRAHSQIFNLGDKPRNLSIIARQDLHLDIVEIKWISRDRSEVAVDDIRDANGSSEIRIAKIESDNAKLVELVRYLAFHDRAIHDPPACWHTFGHALRSTRCFEARNGDRALGN